jgi:integration host factor subunit beta
MAGNKYTKADIVDSMYQKTGMNRKEIRTLVDLFLDEIKDALIKRMIIELRGFGTFEIRIRKGRQKARNPRTGKTVSVNSHGIAAFRPGQELKRDVWNLGDEEAFFDGDSVPMDGAGGLVDSGLEVFTDGGAGDRVAGFEGNEGIPARFTAGLGDDRVIAKTDGSDT